MELLQRAQELIESAVQNGQTCGDLRSLARELRSMAIDLSSNRVTEFSPEISELHLAAAKAAVLCIDSSDEEFKQLERDILYYGNFPSTQSLVNEYLAFKKRVSPNNLFKRDASGAA